MQDLVKGLSRRGALAGGAGLVGAAWSGAFSRRRSAMDNGAHGEFGFLAGDWRVKHRKLKSPPRGRDRLVGVRRSDARLDRARRRGKF